jgi:NADH-quinone oxidoreductase subunit H
MIDLIGAAKSLFLFTVIALAFAPLMTWIERKQSALMQDRLGANRADVLGFRIMGLFHPVADMLKMVTKEVVVPEGAHRLIYTLSPYVAAIPAMISFAVIPFGGTYEAFGARFSLIVADLDWGVLYVLAIGSIATYGSMLAGWASNSNFGMLGSLRVSAQMLSYEVAMGISLIGVFLCFGTLRLTEMGAMQQETFRVLGFLEHLGWVAPGTAWVAWLRLPLWGIFLQPVAFFLFLTAIMAENKRAPFDTPEGESELVAGYFTEYSGMNFGIYLMAEWVEVVVISGLVVAMFLGGWAIPWVSDAALVAALSGPLGPDWGNLVAMAIGVGVFFFKVVVLIFFQMLIRWSMPRFRYDQVMNLGWKILLPLALANIVVTALGILVIEEVAGR